MPLDDKDLQQIGNLVGHLIEANNTKVRESVKEIVRDAQTEILRGLEAFARGNFARLHSLKSSDNDLKVRLGALEERVMALETNPRR